MFIVSSKKGVVSVTTGRGLPASTSWCLSLASLWAVMASLLLVQSLTFNKCCIEDTEPSLAPGTRLRAGVQSPECFCVFWCPQFLQTSVRSGHRWPSKQSTCSTVFLSNFHLNLSCNPEGSLSPWRKAKGFPNNPDIADKASCLTFPHVLGVYCA
jgi:hypothetical protein